MSLNKVILIGRLTNDPQMRSTVNSQICGINLAINEKSSQGEHVEFVRVTLFNRLAEISGKYLRKGSQVYVEGKLRIRKYTDRDGVEKQSTEVLANEMQMLDRKDSYGSSSSSSSSGYANSPGNDDDVPF